MKKIVSYSGKGVFTRTGYEEKIVLNDVKRTIFDDGSSTINITFIKSYSHQQYSYFIRFFCNKDCLWRGGYLVEPISENKGGISDVIISEIDSTLTITCSWHEYNMDTKRVELYYLNAACEVQNEIEENHED